MIPVFLLMCGLVIDAGNWYTHKRQLQNKADAGALAAGVEYIAQMANCKTLPGATGTAISNVAKNFAGTNEATGGTKYNQTINVQGNLTVAINATSATAADWTDGGSPCFDHNTGDTISPNGGLWTDVKVRETSLGSLASGFGLNLPSVTAQARVELNQVVTLQGGLPFVNETGDQIECVWAEFVRARDNSTSAGFSVSPSNPILMTKTAQGTWTANITNLQFTNAHDDVAIRYYAGSKDGAAPCNFATQNKGGLPHDWDVTERAHVHVAQRLRHGRVARSRQRTEAASLRADLQHVRRPGLPLHGEHRSERHVSRRLLRGGRHRAEQGAGHDHRQPHAGQRKRHLVGHRKSTTPPAAVRVPTSRR